MASSSSSWNREKSTLFSSEKGTLQAVPFLNDDEIRNCEDTAGDKTTPDGVELNCGNFMDNLDDLTEEELDELLQEAWDINQRLKSFESSGKFTSRSRGEQSLARKEYGSGTGSVTKQNSFLPPLEPTKTSLVTGVVVVMGTKSNAAGRQKKTSVM